MLPPEVLPPTVVKGSLRADGTREVIHTADVHGRFTTARSVVFALLIAVWLALPVVRVRGNPAVFLDIEHRRFYVLGATFNAQDTWLLFFVLSGIGFSLIYVTAWLGRVWCGWACPQTVLLDGIFRRVERWIQGSRDVRMHRDARPWDWGKTWRKVATHTVFVLLAVGIALVFLSYFLSMPGLLGLLAPTRHPEAVVWALALSGVFYFNFAFFREQLCLAICPYGRLQSALIDADSIVIGYDARRGEPRTKATHRGSPTGKGSGDCVDCKRCVVVCPTGIDIRNGLQIDCIACTACIDACDDIMDKLGRGRGLIRYASTSSLGGGRTRYFRPRILIYSALGALGLATATLALGKHQSFEANLLRLPGSPYVFDGDQVRDGFEVHVVNKTGQPETYAISAEGDAAEASYVVSLPSTRLGALEGTRVPVLVSLPRRSYDHDFAVRVRVKPASTDEPEVVVTGRFLGARGGG